jgi:hypothetical protein
VFVRAGLSVMLGAGALLAPATLFAEQPDTDHESSDSVPELAPRAPVSPEQARLDEAKELFRKANELRAAADYEGALDFYLRSRRVVPSVPNTLNAALTLDHLGRYDEALEMYESLLTSFPDLDEKDRKSIGPAMSILRNRLGMLDVSSNVAGVLMIDGRQRGKLPLASPLPVMPGSHVVRVLKDGYDTFEQNIEIKAREKLLIDARLARLTRVGKLRVDDPKLAGADLFIDGGKVGTLPWEGTLAPGRHRYQVRKDEIGSAPRSAIVVEGQTVLVEPSAGPLGPDLRFVVDPPSAQLVLDGVLLGEGQWQGRLPVGRYLIEAREPGYVVERRYLDVTRDRGGTSSFNLAIDEDSPRWARKEIGKLWLEGFVGYGLAGSFGSDMEAHCDRGACSDSGMVAGPVLGARVGWEFPIGASVELGLGFLSLSTELEREVADSYDDGVSTERVSVEYHYRDRIRLEGPFVLAGAAFPIALGARFELGLRADIGVVFAGVRDTIDATASAEGRSVPAEVQNSGKTVRSAAVFAAPELRLSYGFDAFKVGVGIAALIFPTSGPRLETGDTRAKGTDACAVPPYPVDCAKNSDAVAAERSFSPFIVWLPSISAGYTF